MRDLVVTMLVLGSLPFILMRPWIGILVWSWLGYMNPHRLTFGFAFNFPFSMLVATVTLVAVVFSSEKRRFPITPLTVVWLVFIFWMNLTTVLALNPEGAWAEWDRAMKIQLFALLTVYLINNPERVKALVWVIALSLGFFGGKGGLFSIASGGQYLVFGPPGSFFAENNTLALALIMTLPLVYYLQQHASRRWMRWGLTALIGLMMLSILTSHSRGALLAGSAMLAFLILKSRHKVRFALAALIAVPLMLSFMPEKWFDRMSTISTYDEDASAMGRINAWYFAYNLALDRPIVGGGFLVFTPELFLDYAPDPDDFHDAHSIYFEVLGEHGFVGLGLFGLLGWLTFRSGSWIIRAAKERPDLVWARDLAAMIQVSLVGYAVGGAFLGLAYFDLYYHFIGIIVILRQIVQTRLAEEPEPAPERTEDALQPGSAPSAPPGRALPAARFARGAAGRAR